MQVWIRVGIAVIFSAIFSISAAANQVVMVGNQLLKEKIGVAWQEFKNCKSDADCTMIVDLTDCSGVQVAINKNFEDKVNKYVIEMPNKIREEMASTDRYERHCSWIKDFFSKKHAVCRNSQCEEVLTTHLTENEARKIADETMRKHGFSLKDFSVGTPMYDEAQQTWHNSYIPESGFFNKYKSRDEAGVSSYVVTIYDTTGDASVTKYWKY